MVETQTEAVEVENIPCGVKCRKCSNKLPVDHTFKTCAVCLAKHRLSNRKYSKTTKGKTTIGQYDSSDHGKETRKAYANSEAGKESKQKYESSEPGKETRKAYASSINLKILYTGSWW